LDSSQCLADAGSSGIEQYESERDGDTVVTISKK
jgi:hypothetical protein